MSLYTSHLFRQRLKVEKLKCHISKSKLLRSNLCRSKSLSCIPKKSNSLRPKIAETNFPDDQCAGEVAEPQTAQHNCSPSKSPKLEPQCGGKCLTTNCPKKGGEMKDGNRRFDPHQVAAQRRTTKPSETNGPHAPVHLHGSQCAVCSPLRLLLPTCCWCTRSRARHPHHHVHQTHLSATAVLPEQRPHAHLCET